MKNNRLINPDRSINIPVSPADITKSGNIVHIKVFRNVKIDDDAEYRSTGDLETNNPARLKPSEVSRMIKIYHSGIRHFRTDAAKSNRDIIAFLRIEYHCFVKGVSQFEAKTSVIRDTVRAYLAQPIYTLDPVNLYIIA